MIRIYRDGETRDVAHVYRGFRQEVPEVRKWHGGAMHAVHSRVLAEVEGGVLSARLSSAEGGTWSISGRNAAVADGVLEIS